MRVLPKALEISDQVIQELAKRGGRAADTGISLPFLASMAAAAGDGDHVDIGSLYGASAIVVALMKKEMGLKGDIYCIDPYDKLKRDLAVAGQPSLESPVSATPEELMANAEHFEVELKLIRKPSHPWPDELKDNVFVSAYVDGDHLGDAPKNDFLNLRGRVTGYIGTDNFEEEYMDVTNMILFAAAQEDWFLWYKNLIFAALRRTMPSRTHSASQGLAYHPLLT